MQLEVRRADRRSVPGLARLGRFTRRQVNVDLTFDFRHLPGPKPFTSFAFLDSDSVSGSSPDPSPTRQLLWWFHFCLRNATDQNQSHPIRRKHRNEQAQTAVSSSSAHLHFKMQIKFLSLSAGIKIGAQVLVALPVSGWLRFVCVAFFRGPEGPYKANIYLINKDRTAASRDRHRVVMPTRTPTSMPTPHAIFQGIFKSTVEKMPCLSYEKIHQKSFLLK